MPVSWAPNELENPVRSSIVPQDGSTAAFGAPELERHQKIVDAFALRGSFPHDFQGHHNELLRTGARALVVVEGAVDLFLVSVVDGEAVGRRRHALRIERGGLICGMSLVTVASADGSGTEDFGVLAVGVSGTRVIDTSIVEFWPLACQAAGFTAAVALLEDWLTRVGAAMIVPTRVADIAEAVPGETACVRAETNFGPIRRFVWLAIESGDVLLLDRVPLEASAEVRWPVPSRLWVHTLSEATIRTYSTVDLLADRGLEAATLAPFHELVVEVLATTAGFERLAGEVSLDKKINAERERFRRAMRRLADGGAASREGASDHEIGQPAIEKVFRFLAHRLAFPVVLPSAAPDEVDLGMLARASTVSTREVLLERGWWLHGYESYVARRLDTDAPVAIFPYRRGYGLWDPDVGRVERVNEAIAKGLMPRAVAVYAPLPSRPIGPIALLRFAVQGARDDLQSLVLTGGVVGAFGLAVPVAFGHFVDDVLPAARLDVLVEAGIAMGLVAVTSGIIHLANALAAVRIESKMSARLQAAVWGRLIALPAPFFRGFNSGDLAERANGMERARAIVARQLMGPLLTGVFSLINIFLMLAYDVRLTLYAVAFAFLDVLVVATFARRSVQLRRHLAKLEGELAGMLLQFITAIAKLRVAGAETLAFERWARRYAKKSDVDADAFRNHGQFTVLSSVIPIAALGLLFAMAGLRSSSELSTGSFVAFLSTYGSFVAGLAALVLAAASLFDMVPLLERASPILEAIPEVDRTKRHPGKLRGHIEVSHATFRYSPSGPAILSEIDLEVAPAEFVAIVGPSGSGKSTLLRLLLGFEKPDSGGVYYDGQDLSTLDVREVRRQVGVVLQNGELDSDDIFKNIVGTRKLSHADAWEAARIAGLDDDIRKMPMEMRTVLGRSQSVSGGQRQRILIARAVVCKPKVLFLDEATSALDATTQDAVMRALDTFKATRIVIAHRLSTVRNANRIVVLEAGKIVQIGDYDRLMSTPGPFRRLVERQLG